jgi:hypothetical protein
LEEAMGGKETPEKLSEKASLLKEKTNNSNESSETEQQS